MHAQRVRILVESKEDSALAHPVRSERGGVIFSFGGWKPEVSRLQIGIPPGRR